MNVTNIEWCRRSDGKPGYTVNPVKGYCPVACSYCYARRMYDRFHWDKTVRLDTLSAFHHGVSIRRVPSGSKIFVGSTIELFGNWVQEEWLHKIFNYVRMYKQHTFIFLTKLPENLSRWNPFPDNAWVGVTATDDSKLYNALAGLRRVEAKVRFLSMEPLLGWDGHGDYAFITNAWRHWLDWVIIGAQTGAGAKKPDPAWVQSIIDSADRAGVPVFLKDNLGWPEKRQEFPQV